jgi:putative protease
MTELLAPAGNLEKLKIAIHYGADAVYFGGQEFSLRAQAGNFSQSEMEAAVNFAHDHGARAYVTVNIFAHNRDMKKIPEYLRWLSEIGVDALIISDPGIFRLAGSVAPDIPVHVYTQANTTNLHSARFWKQAGASRVNLARELSLEEIREITASAGIETEVFVHGALCISYSGRCMLSLYMTGRDANQGACAHPCRYRYSLQEEKRPGLYFPVEEDERGVYIFNSRDLCLINRLPELIETGVDSLKIEGRMKGIFYVAGVVRAYRAALDWIREHRDPDGWVQGHRPEIPSRFMEELKPLGSRGYTENFLDGPPDSDDMLYHGGSADQTFSPAAVVVQAGKKPLLRVGHILRPGDRLEYMETGLGITRFEVIEVLDREGRKIKQALGGDIVSVTTEPEVEWEAWAVVRRVNSEK